MTKSIISGLGLFAVVIAILLWLGGVYELTGAGALALGFIGFVLAIFFARFGGFKPFFPSVETPRNNGEQETLELQHKSIRRLAGVGADPEGGESLFEERSPDHLPSERLGNYPIFDEADDSDDDAIDEEPHPPLFGEMLSEQLARDPSDGEPLFDELPPDAVTPRADDTTGFIWNLRAGEKASAERAEPHLPSPGTVVDGKTADADADIDLDDIDADELAASLDALEPVDPSDAAVEVDYVAEPMVSESTGLAVASGTELPVVVENQVPLELHKYSTSEIMSVVKSQESVLVDTLIDEGVLSTSGPITDKDIRTMVFVAVSSNELIDVLTQAQQEAVALNGGGEHALGTGD